MSRRCHINNKVKLHKQVAKNICDESPCKATLRYYHCDTCGFYHLTSSPIKLNAPRTVFLNHYKDFKKYL